MEVPASTTHQVSIAVDVIDAANGWPEFVGLHPGRRERGGFAGVGPVPLILEAHLPRVRRRLQRTARNTRFVGNEGRSSKQTPDAAQFETDRLRSSETCVARQYGTNIPRHTGIRIWSSQAPKITLLRRAPHSNFHDSTGHGSSINGSLKKPILKFQHKTIKSYVHECHVHSCTCKSTTTNNQHQEESRCLRKLDRSVGARDPFTPVYILCRPAGLLRLPPMARSDGPTISYELMEPTLNTSLRGVVPTGSYASPRLPRPRTYLCSMDTRPCAMSSISSRILIIA